MAQATLITGKGDRVKLFLTLLAQGIEAEPTPFTVTPTADIPAGATDFTPTAALAAGENIAAGTPIQFQASNGNQIIKTVFSTMDVIGDGVTIPTISIRPAYSTITAGPGQVGPIRLLGGRTLDLNFGINTVEALHHEDSAAYLVSALVSKNLEIPWTGDILPSYVSYFMVKEILAQADPTIWFELELSPPKGFSKGFVTKGQAIFGDYSETWPSDAECQYNITLRNQGTPEVVQPTI